MGSFCSPELTCQRWIGSFYLCVPMALMLWSKQTSIKDEFCPAGFLPCVREYLFIIMLVSVIKTLVQMRVRGMSSSRFSAHGWVTRQRRAAQQPRWAGACRACAARQCCLRLLAGGHWSIGWTRLESKTRRQAMSVPFPLLCYPLTHTHFPLTKMQTYTHTAICPSRCVSFSRWLMREKKLLPRCSLITYQISHKNKLTVMYFRIYFFCNMWSFLSWNTQTKK